MQTDKKNSFEDRKDPASLTGLFGQDRMREEFTYSEVNTSEPLAPETLNLLKENRRRNVRRTIFTFIFIFGLVTTTVETVSAAHPEGPDGGGYGRIVQGNTTIRQ